jgi:hypothetical protein
MGPTAAPDPLARYANTPPSTRGGPLYSAFANPAFANPAFSHPPKSGDSLLLVRKDVAP